MMVYKRTIKTQKAILWALTLETEAAQYDLPDYVQRDYTTILRRLRDLEKQGLVKVDRTVASKKKGKDKKIYRLTLTGLVSALSHKDAWEHIDTIAEKHPDLLLTFKKWKFFVDRGLRDDLVRDLRKALDVSIDLLGFVSWAQRLQPNDRPRITRFATEQIITKESIDTLILRPLHVTNPTKLLEDKQGHPRIDRLKASKDDPELREFIEKGITQRTDAFLKYLKNSKEWIEWWDSL